MTRNLQLHAIAALAVLLTPLVGLAQDGPSETIYTVSEDIDLLEMLGPYDLMLDQLQKMIPILDTVEFQRQAVVDYRTSDEALAPMRALRAALLSGAPTAQLLADAQPVWNAVVELEEKHEASLGAAMAEVAGLLTDEQLGAARGGDWSYDEVDGIFADLEDARLIDSDEYSAWVDATAQEIAFREGGPDAAEAAKLQATVKAYLTKVPKLSAAEFEEQYDDLFDELQAIIDASMPRPTREIMEAQVAEDLGYIFMSERTLALIKALAASRAEG